MFRVSQLPSSGVLKTVTAASGRGHNTGTATSLQLGLIRPWWITNATDANKNPTRCNSMQIFIYCKVTLHVSGVTAPSGVLKTVTAASGTGHNTGTATSLQRLEVCHPRCVVQ